MKSKNLMVDGSIFIHFLLMYLTLSMPWKPKKEKGPLHMEKSKASILYDKEGRTYIDYISGVSHGKFRILR